MCAKAEDGTHTLMKSDEAVETENDRRYALLLAFRRVRDLNLGDVVAMDMYDRFSLCSLCQIVMSFAVRYSKRDVVWIKLAYWSDDVQIASKNDS